MKKDISENFDYNFYVSYYKDIAELSFEDALLHWKDFGIHEGRYGTEEQFYNDNELNIKDLPENFNVDYYFLLNPDLDSRSKYHGIIHFLKWGLAEGRKYQITSEPDNEFIYNNQESDIKSFGEDHRKKENKNETTINFTLRNEIIGNIDVCDENGILGWALNQKNIYESIEIELYIDNEFITRTIANIFRDDLYKVGTFGYGQCGFNIPILDKLFDNKNHIVEIKDIFGGVICENVNLFLSGRPEFRNILGRSYSTSEINCVARAFQFDSGFYKKQYLDMLEEPNPKDHYFIFGEDENRKPNSFFSPEFYRNKYSQFLTNWEGKLLDHFLSIGLFEGYYPSKDVESVVNKSGFFCTADWLLYFKKLLFNASRISESLTNNLDVLSSCSFEIKSSIDLFQTRNKKDNQKGNYKKILNWVIPSFSNGGGGHTTIFRCARNLTRNGWKSIFWIYNSEYCSDIENLKSQFIAYFPVSPVEFRLLSDGFSEVNNEFIIATAWQSVYFCIQNEMKNIFLYFVQDYEPSFNASSTESLRAEWTYQLGFDVICAGKYLENTVGNLTNRIFSFELAADPIYKLTQVQSSIRPISVAIYVRTHTERRCSDLMIEIANMLAERISQTVVIFGDDSNIENLNPLVKNEGILTPIQMAELFKKTKCGLVASATNYSIVPVEMAAAGMLVCQPSSFSTNDTTVVNGVVSLPPNKTDIVNYISEACEKWTEEQFKAAISKSHSWANKLDWESEFDKVSDFIEQYIINDESQLSTKSKKSVAIAIPTYYPDERIIEIVDRIKRQKSSYEIKIIIIDSVRENVQSPLISGLSNEKIVEIHSINAKNFQHGATRNLAVEKSNSDYIVFITQDALPVNEYWLESLIAPMDIWDTVAFVFGRHVAYPEHHKLYDVELGQFFDGLINQGIIRSRIDDPKKYDSDKYHKASVCFNSDNNAAYRCDLLKRIKFPNVDFSEDQAVARRFIERGFYKAYSPTAIVMHSHDYTEDHEEAYKRGTEEGLAFKKIFDLTLVKDIQDLQSKSDYTYESIQRLSIENGFSEDESIKYIKAKIAYLNGVFDSGKLSDI